MNMSTPPGRRRLGLGLPVPLFLMAGEAFGRRRNRGGELPAAEGGGTVGRRERAVRRDVGHSMPVGRVRREVRRRDVVWSGFVFVCQALYICTAAVYQVCIIYSTCGLVVYMRVRCSFYLQQQKQQQRRGEVPEKNLRIRALLRSWRRTHTRGRQQVFVLRQVSLHYQV